MIVTEANPAMGLDAAAVTPIGAAAESTVLSRLLLAILLAAFSALIPGEADRFLETQCGWSDLWPLRWRSPAGIWHRDQPTPPAPTIV